MEYSIRTSEQFHGKDSGFVDVKRGETHAIANVFWSTSAVANEAKFPYIYSQAQAQLVAQIIADALNARAADIAALDPQEVTDGR